MRKRSITRQLKCQKTITPMLVYFIVYSFFRSLASRHQLTQENANTLRTKHECTEQRRPASRNGLGKKIESVRGAHDKLENESHMNCISNDKWCSSEFSGRGEECGADRGGGAGRRKLMELKTQTENNYASIPAGRDTIRYKNVRPKNKS